MKAITGLLAWNQKLFILLCGYLLILILSSFLGVDLGKSIFGNYWRTDGLIVLINLSLLSFFFSSQFVKNKKVLSLINKTTGLSNIIISLWAITRGVENTGFGNPVFLAGYLVITFPFTSYLTLPLSLWAIFVTHSEGAIITSFLFLFLKLNNKIIRMLFLSGAIFVLLMVGSNYLSTKNSYRGFIPQSRERILVKSLRALGIRPVFGWGVSNFDYAFASVIYPERYLHDVYVDKAHSNIVEAFVTTGIVGGVYYLGILLVAFVNLYRKRKNKLYLPWFLFLVLFIFHSQTNIIPIWEEILFWIALGLSFN